jgi:hypothetical protein
VTPAKKTLRRSRSINKHIEPPKRDRVNGEEVTRERSGPLSAEELRARRPRSTWRRSKMVTAKDVAYACRRDGDAELCALTDDTQIAPSRVLQRDAEHESHDLSIERVVGAIVAMSKRPIPSYELAVWRMSVAGVTRKVTQRPRGSNRASVASTARSVGEYRGRVTWRRSTAS